MKRYLPLAALLLALGLQSCQCANKPPIGPIEDEARVERPDEPALPPAAERLV